MSQERPPLALPVPDSGNTICVEYDEIRRIPPDSLTLGDVLIVSRQGHDGVMFMQVTLRNPTGGWVLEAVEATER